MLMVSEQVRDPKVSRFLRAGLAEDAERWEREDDARGPEPEGRWVLSRGRWVQVAALPSGFVAVEPAELAAPGVEAGADELRVRWLMIAAQARFGWGRAL